MGVEFYLAGGEVTVLAKPVSAYYYLMPGFLLGLIIFGFILIVFMLRRYFRNRKLAKELLLRAEIRGEYEDRRREKISRSLKERNLKKKEVPVEPKPAAEHYLKDEERQIVNVLRQREGSCEQGTLRVVTGMPKSTLSRILKELEDRNIIYKEKRGKKNITITKKEHDAWHKKNPEYGDKMDKEHERCHKKIGITVKG